MRSATLASVAPGPGGSRPSLPPLASLHLSREPYATVSDLPVVNVICPLLNQREQILIPDNFIRRRRIKLLQLFDAFIAMERRLIMQYNSRFWLQLNINLFVFVLAVQIV